MRITQELQIALDKHLVSIETRIKILQEKVESLKCADDINWATAGSLARIDCELGEMLGD